MPTILVPVTVSPTAGNRFIARAEAEGSTAEEAVANLQAGPSAGGRVIAVPEVAPGENPWLAVAGMWKDVDPELIAEWRKAVEEYRQERDRETPLEDAP